MLFRSGMLINQLFDHSNLDVKNVKDIIIATVVPSVLYTLQHLATKYFNRKAIVIESGVKTGLIIRYDNPKQVGSDRIVNAIAAYTKYKGPLILIDFGTATTFCAVTDKAEYLGGAIAPGLKISSEFFLTPCLLPLSIVMAEYRLSASRTTDRKSVV